jgi:BlaI family penicillinase repressor
MKTKIEKISDTEAEIMKVIWGKGEPTTYTEIRSTLNEKFEIGSQSIQTMIKRLIQKGVLKQEKRDVYYYSPLVSEADYVKSKTMTLLDKVFDGDAKGLLSALVSYKEVTPEDLEDLQRFWQKGRDLDE